jgi:2-dehydro-3-deoxyphosphogluconate aldolase/(4S)-4-hydroxy-2-oxoglutarate aldolase
MIDLLDILSSRKVDAVLIAPMPEVPVMPTGGVTIDNGAEYLGRGAVAVGISRSLTGDALTPGGDLDALAQRANTAVSGVAALTAA